MHGVHELVTYLSTYGSVTDSHCLVQMCMHMSGASCHQIDEIIKSCFDPHSKRTEKCDGGIPRFPHEIGYDL